MTQLLYIWPRVFKEIAVQVSKGKSFLNFPHLELHLLIVASSYPPPGQIQSTKIDKIVNYIKFYISKLDFNTRSYINCPSITKTPSTPKIRGSSTSLPGISEHFLWIQNEYPLQKISFFPTPILYIAQEYLPEVYNVWKSLPEIITLVSPKFTFNPFDSRPFFHTAIFVIRPSNVSAKITQS